MVYVPASPGKSCPVRVVWGGLWGEGGSGLDLYLSRSVSCPGLALFASSESVKDERHGCFSPPSLLPSPLLPSLLHAFINLEGLSE